jgi:hypothetical protein
VHLPTTTVSVALFPMNRDQNQKWAAAPSWMATRTTTAALLVTTSCQLRCAGCGPRWMAGHARLLPLLALSRIRLPCCDASRRCACQGQLHEGDAHDGQAAPPLHHGAGVAPQHRIACCRRPAHARQQSRPAPPTCVPLAACTDGDWRSGQLPRPKAGHGAPGRVRCRCLHSRRWGGGCASALRQGGGGWGCRGRQRVRAGGPPHLHSWPACTDAPPHPVPVALPRDRRGPAGRCTT